MNTGRVYPRACGGTGDPVRRCPIPRRSIPAPAGEPAGTRKRRTRSTVYPRACGGTGLRHEKESGWRGLSPRLRGNRDDRRLCDHGRRSIPAPAGEPVLSRVPSGSAGVYPRACGGTLRSPDRDWFGQGLSPRLRGNHNRRCPHARIRGSIPAPAGEPVPGPVSGFCCKVYPRACGGTGCCLI